MTIHEKLEKLEKPEKLIGEVDDELEGESGEGRRPRVRRADPAREKPLREWSGLYRRPPAWSTVSAPADGAQAPKFAQNGTPDDVVSHGVKLGYHVVEENIRQGRHVAQQLNGQASAVGKESNDIGELFSRMARYYTDLGALWSDLLNALAANPDFVNNFLRMWTPSSAPAAPEARPTPTPASAAVSVAVSVELRSSRPAQVTVDLRPYAPGCELVTAGLYAVDSAIPPLREVRFESPLGTGPVVLRIRVPDEQPPEVYTGVIVDKKTNLPQGTVSVRVAAS
jgi:hypothetical protein